VVKEVASLGIVVVMALLFLAFFTTLRTSAIAVVQGDKVIDVAPTKHTLCSGHQLSSFSLTACMKRVREVPPA
jgi:hypothetical protein